MYIGIIVTSFAKLQNFVIQREKAEFIENLLTVETYKSLNHESNEIMWTPNNKQISDFILFYARQSRKISSVFKEIMFVKAIVSS
jgi:hypothetical protein